MVRTCTACGKTDVHEYSHENFYRFPLDPETKAKWISLIGLNDNEIKQLTPYSTLCSDHFNSKDIGQKDNGERFVIPGAIPIFYSRRVRKRRRNQRTLPTKGSSEIQKCIEENVTTIKTEDIECKIEVEDTVLYDELVKNERLSDNEETLENKSDDSIVNFVKIECKPETCKEEEDTLYCNPTQNIHYDEESTDKKVPVAELLISGILHKYQHCGFKTNDRWDLLKHIHKTHIQIMRKCDYCDFRAKSADQLKIHVENEHLKSKLLKCTICDYSCFYGFSLKAHFETIHLKLKDKKCQFCDTSCSSLSH